MCAEAANSRLPHITHLRRLPGCHVWEVMINMKLVRIFWSVFGTIYTFARNPSYHFKALARNQLRSRYHHALSVLITDRFWSDFKELSIFAINFPDHEARAFLYALDVGVPVPLSSTFQYGRVIYRITVEHDTLKVRVTQYARNISVPDILDEIQQVLRSGRVELAKKRKENQVVTQMVREAEATWEALEHSQHKHQ